MATYNDISKLIDKFTTSLETHPNISAIWISYLELKQKALAELLNQGEYAYAQFAMLPDFSGEEINTIVALKLSMKIQ